MRTPHYLAGGIGAYAAPVSEEPSVIVSVQKLGNGYMIELQTNPKQPERPPVKHAPNPFAGLDPDELVDQIIDGFGSLARSINDKSAGEDWKSDDNRKNVRDAFRLMFPSMSSHIDDAVSTELPPVYIEPRHERLVFETKEKLFEYLTSNL